MGKIRHIVGDGAFNRAAVSDDAKAGYIFASIAPTGLELGVVSPELTSIEEAEALGITESWSFDNDNVVHYHLKSHWFRNPGQSVWIMLVDTETTMTVMADNAQPYLSKLILETEGKAKTIGLVLDPDELTTMVATDGMLNDVDTAVAKAQQTIDAHAEKYRNVVVVLEGAGLNGTAAVLKDFRLNEARSVMIAAIQDPGMSSTIGSSNKSASVGHVVGVISFARVHENAGWTEKFNLTDKAEGYFLTVNMTDNKPANLREAEFDTLNNKGITFGRTYAGQAGVYLNDVPTCAALTSDFAYVTETRVINKAIGVTYNALFPKVNGPLKVDKVTGNLDLEVVAAFERLAQDELDTMERNGEISGGECYIDPVQDLKTTGKLIAVIKVVSIDTGREIEVQIGFAKKLG